MQDREENLFNKEFTDRAWSEMRILLDKEMPVNRRSDRMMWLLVLGFVFLGSVGWIFGPSSNFHLNSVSPDIILADQAGLQEIDKKQNVELYPENAKESIASTQNIPAPNLNTKKIEKNNISQPTISEEAKTLVIGGKKVELLPNENQSNNNNNSKSNSNKIVKPGSNDFESINPTNDPIQEVENIISHEQNSTVDKVESENVIMNEPEQNRIPVSALTFLQMYKELEWPLRETPKSIEFKSFVRPNSLPMRWGVQINALSADVPNVNGWSVGVWGQRPHFLSKKLSLRIGLNYQQLNLFPKVASLNTTNDALSINSESDPVTNNPDMAHDTSTAIISAAAVAGALKVKLRNFQLPLSLHWNLGKRFSLIGGAQLSYRRARVSQNTFQPSTTTFSSGAGNRAMDAVFNEFLQLEKGNSFPSENINSWDVGTHLGLGYTIIPRMEAIFTVQYGFNNLFQGLDLELFNRNVNLGISYQF